MSEDHDRTASLMTPAKLAQMKPKPAASPAAWLDRMATDAGHANVVRLGELLGQIQAQAAARDDSRLAQALDVLAQALPRVDFSLVQQNRGWLARATGKGKGAGAEFGAQYELALQAGEAVKTQTQALAKNHQAEAAAAERALVEFEVEWRALEKIIDQGARWLQDMRNQLKARQAAADEDAMRKIREDAARCELLVARLKLLRATSTAAQQAQQLSQAAASRRATLLQLLQQTLASDLRAWQLRLAPVAAALADTGSPALSMEGPQESHAELQAHVQHAMAECAQLREQEHSLTAALALLAQQLEAAG